MKRSIQFIFLFFFLVLINIACVSSKKFYQRGQYDSAINKAVKKIHAKPDNEKEIQILEKSYRAANTKDNDRIQFLRKEGSPNSWDEIFILYSRLNNRQNIIKPILPLQLNGIPVNISIINYDNEIISAKKNAAEYFYANAQRLLKSNDRFNARQAYEELFKVKKYYEIYQDVDALMNQALEKGQSRVYIGLENNTMYKLPQSYIDEMMNIPLSTLNSQWIKYFNQDNNQGFHYQIKLNIKKMDISPESVLHKETIHEKQVQDGTEVLLDANNNTVKDSLGNPIRVPRMVKVSCKLLEVIQKKAIHTEAGVEYIDLETKQTLKIQPVASDYFFENTAMTAVGDLRALDPDIKKQLGKTPVPFPTDPEMIMGGSGIIKKLFHDVLMDNKNYPK